MRYFLNDSEILFNNFRRLFNEFEMFFNDLSSSSKNFGSQKNYKRRPPPPPFVVFSATQQLFRLLLKSLKKHFKIIKQPLKVIKQYFRIINKIFQNNCLLSSTFYLFIYLYILYNVRSVNFFENDSCESKDADFRKVLEILF